MGTSCELGRFNGACGTLVRTSCEFGRFEAPHPGSRGRPTQKRPPRPTPSAAASAAPVLLEVVLELAAAARGTQLAQRLGLDLSDPLARHVEVATDLLERAAPAVLQAESQ